MWEPEEPPGFFVRHEGVVARAAAAVVPLVVVLMLAALATSVVAFGSLITRFADGLQALGEALPG